MRRRQAAVLGLRYQALGEFDGVTIAVADRARKRDRVINDRATGKLRLSKQSESASDASRVPSE